MNQLILALDPGPAKTAWISYDPAAPSAPIRGYGIWPNADVLRHVKASRGLLAVEMIASYGMAVGAEVFETCVWIGRFVERFEGQHVLLKRPDIKLHLCQSRNAKDPNVRQALLDRFGPGNERAIGTKKSPGPLYGVSSHVWSALAVAVTCADTALSTPEEAT